MGGVALVNKDYSDENIKTCALIASLVEGNQFVAASIVDCATQNISEHIICMYDAGNPVVDDIALEQVDAFIKDNELCFMAYMDENFQVIAQENITDVVSLSATVSNIDELTASYGEDITENITYMNIKNIFHI